MIRYLFTLLILAGMSAPALAGARWYGQDRVDRGKAIYVQQCASCHGDHGEGKVADWKKRLPDGTYPPPPVNGNGHAWHHSLDILKRQIHDGGKPLGGTMPSFAEKLDEQDMLDVIAWFQSQWPDKTYAMWAERNPPKVQPVASVSTGQDEPMLRYLRRLSGGRELGKPQATPVPGIHAIRLDSQTLYVTGNGRYAFVGSLIDLKQGRNLTEEAKAGIAREVLDAFGSVNKVIFPAKGEQVALIDVFTDTSCPYCRKLHAEVPQLQAAGVTVRYLPYPRGGIAGPGYQGLRQVWCAEDPLQAMDDIVQGRAAKGDGVCARADLVDKGYRLGEKLGLRGTPTIFLPDGSQVSGYVPAAKLLPMLGVASDKRSGG